MLKLALSVLFVCSLAPAVSAQIKVRLLTNKPSPQPVGTPVGLTPSLDIPGADPMSVFRPGEGQLFRYAVSTDGGPFHILRDFSQQRDFVWAPALYEHQATLRLSVRDMKSKKITETELPFGVVSRVKGTTPVISPTVHPLVPLFSAPPCPQGTQFRVAFRREDDETILRTPLQPCRASLSNNAYVAGMRADAKYRLRAELVPAAGEVSEGSWIAFHTGILDGEFPRATVVVPRTDRSPAAEPFLIHNQSVLTAARRAFATDLNGEIVWYLPSPLFLTRVLQGGRFLGHANGTNSVNMMDRSQLLREVDLVGNTVRETNIGRVAEQLEERGIHSDCRKGGQECVSSFHHEAIRLPNGHTLAIAGLERMFPAGTQGSNEPINITGDLVIELDEDFQVTGVWNAFDHMDIRRASREPFICPEGPGFGGCTPIFISAGAKEWLHSNALNYLPESGDFLVSMPDQNWVVKVDWKNGKGSGKVLWRLGNEGDFTANTSDPYPWFSGQHDAGFDPGGGNVLSLFDNGPVRHLKNPNANTRGQSWKIDEQGRTATLVHNADLGVYSFAVGSAQKLKSGGYSFQAGFINPVSVYTRAIETSADGKVIYALQLDGVIEYRSFRVPDMYSAPGK